MRNSFEMFTGATNFSFPVEGSTGVLYRDLEISDDIPSAACAAVSNKEKNSDINHYDGLGVDEGSQCSAGHDSMEVLLNNIGKIIILLFLCPKQVEMSWPYFYYL